MRFNQQRKETNTKGRQRKVCEQRQHADQGGLQKRKGGLTKSKMSR